MRSFLARPADELICVEQGSEHVAQVDVEPSGFHALARAQLPEVEAGAAPSFEFVLGGDAMDVHVETP